jgi:hypothetical protein
MEKPKPRYVRQSELAARVLNDPRWTGRVISAAIRAWDVLEGPLLTDDGDTSTMVARTALRTALADLSELERLEGGA